MAKKNERKTKEQLEKIKKKYDVEQLYSWSRYHTYCKDPYSYLLKYILRVPEVKKDSIYGVSGGLAHSILEDFYLEEITYDEMIDRYEEGLFNMNMAELKYNRSDEAANEKTADKYESNVRLFFREHTPIKNKCIIEQFVIIKVGKYIFQGYIDFLHKEEDNYIITDWKTSTIYTGKKLIGESGQLILYAEALRQKGIKTENIKIRYNFLKYCTITYTTVTIDKETKLNKVKSKNTFRHEWVSKCSNDIKKWLKKLGYDELEIEDMVQIAISNNNLDNLPDEVQEKFSKDDCYVYVPLTEELLEELKEEIIETLDEVEEKTIEYEKTKDDHLFWTEVDNKNQFFFANLTGYTPEQHKPYGEYLETARMFVDYTEEDSGDSSWLDELD